MVVAIKKRLKELYFVFWCYYYYYYYELSGNYITSNIIFQDCVLLCSTARTVANVSKGKPLDKCDQQPFERLLPEGPAVTLTVLDLLIFLVQVQLTFWINQECHQFCSQYKPSCNHFIFWFIKQGLAPPHIPQAKTLPFLTVQRQQFKACQSLKKNPSLLCQINYRHWIMVVFLMCTPNAECTHFLFMSLLLYGLPVSVTGKLLDHDLP